MFGLPRGKGTTDLSGCVCYPLISPWCHAHAYSVCSTVNNALSLSLIESAQTTTDRNASFQRCCLCTTDEDINVCRNNLSSTFPRAKKCSCCWYTKKSPRLWGTMQNFKDFLLILRVQTCCVVKYYSFFSAKQKTILKSSLEISEKETPA